MKTKDWFMSALEAVVWYVFIYYLLYVLKNEVDLAWSALLLLALAYLGTISCPWVYNSSIWKKTINKK